MKNSLKKLKTIVLTRFSDIVLVAALLCTIYYYFTEKSLQKPDINEETLSGPSVAKIQEQLASIKEEELVNLESNRKINNWDVKIGEFKNIEDTYVFFDELGAKGYNVHTLYDPNRKVFIVLLGPYATKLRASKIRNRINSEYDFDTKIIPFRDTIKTIVKK